MVTIRLHNSLTRKKQVFEPLDASDVRMYVCGPTVYDRAHLGNARPVVVFDVLYRLLRHVYGAGAVTYARNFTDVDDKINARAAQTGRPIGEITEETIAWYHQDMDALGTLRPTHEPRATAYISQMIAMIERLIARGHAYEVAGHVLFDVRSYPAYGRLSGRSVDDMIAGARVEVAPFKRDPMDFVLWKPSDASLPGWESPWGRGRPGWHIECSAMSHELLGASFDIHGGGQDLQFPHHENEMAQSCCAYPDAGFARYWLHNEMVQVEGKKMSKSLGNFFTVRDLLDQGVPGEVIRYVMLQTHYRKPMDWTERKCEEVEKRLDGLLPAMDLAIAQGLAPSGKVRDLPEAVRLGLLDDLNTSMAIVGIETAAERLVNAVKGDILPCVSGTIDMLAKQFLAALDVLGLYELMLKRASRRRDAREQLDDLHLRFVLQYETARQTKDFSAVDALRSALKVAGVEVRMSKASVELIPGPNFDPAKLETLK